LVELLSKSSCMCVMFFTKINDWKQKLRNAVVPELSGIWVVSLKVQQHAGSYLLNLKVVVFVKQIFGMVFGIQTY